MGIEKEIQQQEFRNQYQKATVNLLYTAYWLQEKIKKFLEKEAITPQQYNILRILRGSKKPISTFQIRERMLDKMSDTSRMADRLQAKGLVEKTINAHDKRLVDVVISATGLALLNRLDQHSDELDNLVSGLTEDETKTFNYLLDKLRTI